MGTSGTGHDRCPSLVPDPSGVGDVTLVTAKELEKPEFGFKSRPENFWWSESVAGAKDNVINASSGKRKKRPASEAKQSIRLRTKEWIASLSLQWHSAL